MTATVDEIGSADFLPVSIVLDFVKIFASFALVWVSFDAFNAVTDLAGTLGVLRLGVC